MVLIENTQFSVSFYKAKRFLNFAKKLTESFLVFALKLKFWAELFSISYNFHIISYNFPEF